MINLARKRSTLAVLVIVITLLSIAVFTQLDRRTISQVGSSTTLSSVTTSFTQQKSTTAFGSSGKTVFIGFSKDVNSLVATPSVILNYTFVISQLDQTANHVTLSAISTVPGVIVIMDPKEFTFLGSQEAVTLGISVAPTVSSSTLPVEIKASTASGATNSTYYFRLDKALVVVVASAKAELKPPVLQVGVGQTVRWLDLFEVDDDGNGVVNIMLADGSAASPNMQQNDVWTHTFDKSGTYTYQVTALGFGSSSATIIVSSARP